MRQELPDHLQGLLRPEAYPHPVEAVRVITTHISWVLLTGEFAYKIKRPVRYPFVDLLSAEHRAFLCREEVRLNRRFAPEIYLDVCTVTSAQGKAQLGGTGQVIEHAVRMRQFNADSELARLLERAQIEPSELETFGRDLAVIHAGLPIATASQTWGRPETVDSVMLENVEQCADAAEALGGRNEVLALLEPLRARLGLSAQWMSGRFASGRVRECHGDLHAHNIVRRASRLLAFDCLEFDPALRWIDVADEIAFLLADLDAGARPLHGQAFLGGYLERSGDYQACRLLDLYKAHRSLVRAKIVALRASEADQLDPGYTLQQRERCAAYIDCARRSLRAATPQLILMSGLSGSGKTWLARRLAPGLGAVHVRSDVERRRLAGLGEGERSSSGLGAGAYSEGMSARVYDRLAQCTRDILSGGFTAIVDATFHQRADRKRFSELAMEFGIRAHLIHCHAPQSVLEQRITERSRRANDASEADLSVMRWQTTQFDVLEPGESFSVVDASTTDADLMNRLVRELKF